MKIFVSWSGDASHEVARALKDWLTDVFQALEPDDVFLSSEDIAKGTHWFAELGKVLDHCDFGILCLTPENLAAPWVLFEAGALSKRVEKARVVPLLIGVEKTDPASPLSGFNAAGVEKAEIRKLLQAINAGLATGKLTTAKLNRAFDTYWPQLEPLLQAALVSVKSERQAFDYDVFLSAPMAAFTNDVGYQAARAECQKIHEALVVACGLRVYWAAKDILSIADFDTIDVSVQTDLQALNASRHFLLLYPQPMVTSALFEAGYALALRKPSHYFVRDRADLPFLMRELPGAAQNIVIHTKQEWTSYDQLAKKLKKLHGQWFPR